MVVWYTVSCDIVDWGGVHVFHQWTHGKKISIHDKSLYFDQNYLLFIK